MPYVLRYTRRLSHITTASVSSKTAVSRGPRKIPNLSGAPFLYQQGDGANDDDDDDDVIYFLRLFVELPWWLRWSRICLQCRRPGFDPWVRKIPWRRKQQPTPVFLPG